VAYVVATGRASQSRHITVHVLATKLIEPAALRGGVGCTERPAVISAGAGNTGCTEGNLPLDGACVME
jgi:hypothetical protein